MQMFHAIVDIVIQVKHIDKYIYIPIYTYRINIDFSIINL